jgi:hypothetical protein
MIEFLDVFVADCWSRDARNDLGQKSQEASASNATTSQEDTG